MTQISYIKNQLDLYRQNGYIISLDAYNQIRNSNEKECFQYIKFHTFKSAEYIKSSQLKQLLIDIYNYHINSKNLCTENFTFMIDEAPFILYIDADYDMINLDTTKATEINNTFAKLITLDVYNILLNDQLKNNINIFTFVPEELKENDNHKIPGGIHIFIYLPYMLIGNDRGILINKILQKIYNNQQIISIINQFTNSLLQHGEVLPLNINNLIDLAPLNRYSSSIIPFAKKHWNFGDKVPRNYKIIIYQNTTNNAIDDMIIPAHSQASFNEVVSKTKMNINLNDITINDNINNNNNNNNNNSNIFVTSTPLPLNTPNFIDKSISERRKEFKNYLNVKFNQYNWTSTNDLINQCCFMFDFCSALSILDDSHPFIEQFQKGNWMGDEKSANKFVKLLSKVYYVIFYLNIGIPEDFDDFLPELILLTLDCLYYRGGKTNRNDVLSQIKNYIKYNISCHFENHDNVYDKLKDSINRADAIQYGNVKHRATIKRKQDLLIQCMGAWNKVKNNIDTILTDFTAYVLNNIMRKMKKEIEPFNKTKYTRDINKYSFLEMKSNPEDYEFYIEQLRNLNKGYLFCCLYQYGLQCYNNIVEEIINCYMNYYIYCVTNNNVHSIYIYNIQQTTSLESLPYNQWVLDNTNSLSNWITQLLSTTVEPISIREIYNGLGGINYMLKTFVDDYELLEKVGRDKNAINFLIVTNSKNNFKRDVVTNISKHYAEMKEENILTYPAAYGSDYFAVRNGIIHYYLNGNKWDVEFLTENHDILLESYSMSKFTTNYDKNNDYYKEIIGILNDIYPDPLDREYIINMFSSAVCPRIIKDNFLFMYGGGSDGKSTINTILRLPLGGSKEVTCFENGKQIKLRNPCGYYGTMEPSAMTGVKTRGSADEGGTINLINKTYCAMMEPQGEKIKSNTIKTWTGNGIIQARAIFKASQEAHVNCLIVCETNTEPSYDIIDDAIKRRVKFYYHQGKFYTESNKHLYKYTDKRCLHRADPDKINKITENVEYWEAFLHILVEHAVNLLNDGIETLSNIKFPDSVRTFTSNSFKKSSSLSGWLENNIIVNAREVTKIGPNGEEIEDVERSGWISVSKLIEKIKLANNNKDMRLLEANIRNSKAINDEIIKSITNTYAGCLFRLKPEYIAKDNTNMKNIEFDDNKINEVLQQSKSMTVEDFIEKYVADGFAVKSIIESKTTDSYKDMVILGVSFADEVSNVGNGNVGNGNNTNVIRNNNNNMNVMRNNNNINIDFDDINI